MSFEQMMIEEVDANLNPDVPVMPPIAEALPLSFGQQRLWFLHRMDPASPAYNMAGAYRLSGSLDRTAFAQAFAEIVRRHEVLRSVYTTAGEEPVQIVQPPAPLAVPLVDLSGLEAGAREEEARRIAAWEAARPFVLDLPLAAALEPGTGEPALRASLVRITEREHLALVNVHHIACDGWSIGVLLRELGALYGAFAGGRPSPLPELPIQYVDFAVWQREQLAGEAAGAQLEYWRERLDGAPPVLELPLDRPRPPVRGSRGSEVGVQLPAALSEALGRIGRREGATLFMTLLAGFQAVLSRDSGAQDLAVGTPVAGRVPAETEGLIGFFVNTLVVRADLGGRPSLRDLVARVKEAALGAYEHQDVPFERLVEELVPQRDLSHTPLFQVFFAFEERAPEPVRMPGLELARVRIPAETAKLDLALSLAGGPAGLNGFLEYSADLFDRTTIQRLARRFERLLWAAAEDPERPVDDLAILPSGERHQVTVEWAAGTALGAYRGHHGLCIHEAFEEQAARTPELPALRGEGVRLTYAELNRQADAVARRLAEQGVGPEDLVAVLLERSPELIVAVLGILKAGAAYVPLDPSHPEERRAFMLEDSGARVVMGRSGEPSKEIAGRRARFGDPDNLAYLIYTSGSTGRPKGVAMPHRGVVRLALGNRYAPIGPGDRMAQAANTSFDAAAFETWSALLNGAELVVLPAQRMSLEELGDFLEREEITAFCPTSSLFNQMVDGPLPKLAAVRQILVGGEVVSAAHVRKLMASPEWNRPGRRVVCCYGPTENTTFTSCLPLDETARPVRSPVPIGRPIAGTRVHLLDRELSPVPIGVAGDLYAAGDGLARGYLGRSDLTAERFVPNPLGEPGSRLYRTGDRARWLADGILEFLGRADGQVKLRGFRIEPGEIEAALAASPAVEQAAVLLREDGPAGRRLVACLVPAAGAARDTAAVRSFLRNRLPEPLVPSTFAWLDALPLTGHGKVDRRALARLEERAEPGALEKPAAERPRTLIEEGLAGIWADVLGVASVRLDDDFFELGGHSLLATQVASRVREAFGVELPLRELFAAPRLADLAARIEDGLGVGSLSSPPIVPLSKAMRASGLPLTFGQEWMWVADQLDPAAAVHNAPLSVRLRGPLAPAALEEALCQIVRRHEGLHIRFVVGENGPFLKPDPDLPVPFQSTDLSALPAARREPEAIRVGSAEAARPFDLATGLPLRCLLVRLEPDHHLLLIALHHLVIDGWSFGVLLREVPVFYEAARTGAPPVLPDLPLQFGDYAVWQRDWLTGEPLEAVLGYWREHLKGPIPVLELPGDRQRTARGILAPGERLLFRLAPGPTDALRALARRRGSTLFAVLLAAFETLLARLSGQEDLVVAAPVANRTRRELEGLIGYFANDLPLRTKLEGDPSFLELLDRVHETALGAWAHQSLPLAKIFQELYPERAGVPAPVLRAYFQLLNAPMPDFMVPGLALEPFDLDARIATFDLAMITREVEGGVDGQLIGSRELFLRPAAVAILRTFQVLVDGIVADPERPISELPVLAEEERQALLYEWNPVPSAAREGRLLHKVFEAVAAARPEAPAVTFEGQTLTYGELNRRADELAGRLIASGVGPESRVGLSLERSLELVVGILGTLKAGGAYVPLDPEYPRERLDWLLKDARVEVLVTGGLGQEGPGGREGHGEKIALLVLDVLSVLAPADVASRPVPRSVGADSLAYIIYTSGSTGRPKGVMVTHRQAARLFDAARGFGFGADDVWTLFHSYAFDFSVWELWGALLHGGRLVVVPRWVSRSPEAFLDLLVREGVTVLNQTPSAFYALARAEEGRTDAPPLRLRRVIFGGEALEPRKLLPWIERHGETRPELVNMYGITETTVHTTLRPLTRADAVSADSVLGRPLDDLRLFLLDRGFELVPVVAVGEIFVGGGGVARGYFGRPDLTAERFVPDPFSGEPGARLYRSGDLARRRPNGEIEYRGRADQQVKVRGFRIEPGEVEAALVRHPAVAQASVFARRVSAEDVRLVACVVPRGEVPSVAELRDHLLALLPEPWVPSLFVAVPELPLTAHGKVDRKALAETADLSVSPDPVETETSALSPVEEMLSKLWAGLLEIDHVGRDDNFFALGGHSLLMTRVASRIRKTLGITPPMRTFFDRPTVANLAVGILGGLAGRLGAERLEALVSFVRDLPEQEVARLLAVKRAGAPSPAQQGRDGEGASAAASGRPLPVPPPRWSAGEGAPAQGAGAPRLELQGARIRDVLAVLPVPAPEAPLRVETVAFPTCNRPDVLERGLASYAEASREHGRALRFAVLDDSGDRAVRDEYRGRLAALRRRYGMEISYAGLEEKRRFAAALRAEGVDPAVVAAALTDPEGVGVPIGTNRNFVLLQTVGEGVLSVDDDTLARGGPPPEQAAGVSFLSGTSPGTAFLSGRDPGAIHGFGSRAEALSAIDPRPVDLPGVHESMLGRELASWLGGLDPEAPAGLDTGDPNFLRSLEAGGRVLVTTNGWAGDCGWRQPTFLMLLAGDSWRRLVRSGDAYRTVTASKEIVRFVPRPTVGNGDSFMATLFTGLDNRHLLPPFPPVLWGEDLLFGIALQLAFPSARVGHLPWVATHEPLEHRAFWPGEMVRSASGIDHSRLASALLVDFEPDPAASSSEALRRLGAFLQGLGRMAPAEFDELARRRVRDRAEAFAAALEARLAGTDRSGFEAGELWAADVGRYLGLLRQHLEDPLFAVPLDLLYGREPEEARRLAQRLVLNYGTTVAGWPDLVEAARALKAKGQGLAEAVR